MKILSIISSSQQSFKGSFAPVGTSVLDSQPPFDALLVKTVPTPQQNCPVPLSHQVQAYGTLLLAQLLPTHHSALKQSLPESTAEEPPQSAAMGNFVAVVGPLSGQHYGENQYSEDRYAEKQPQQHVVPIPLVFLSSMHGQAKRGQRELVIDVIGNIDGVLNRSSRQQCDGDSHVEVVPHLPHVVLQLALHCPLDDVLLLKGWVPFDEGQPKDGFYHEKHICDLPQRVVVAGVVGVEQGAGNGSHRENDLEQQQRADPDYSGEHRCKINPVSIRKELTQQSLVVYSTAPVIFGQMKSYSALGLEFCWP